MNQVAKWVWTIILAAFTLGYWVFVFLLAETIVILLIWWLKPEWLEKM